MKLNNYFNLDCMEGMKQFPDKFFDLAIVDPEYGRKEHGGKDRSKFVKQKNGTKIYVPSGDYPNRNWDNKPAGEEYFRELFRVSKHQIVWGENYMPVKFGKGRIVWDKCNQGSDQSDCEIAYNSLTDRVDLFRYMWRGMMQGKSIIEGHIQQGNKKLNEKRIHPTQKPIALYTWILQQYAQRGVNVRNCNNCICSKCNIRVKEKSMRYCACKTCKKFNWEETNKCYFLKDNKNRGKK